jgi:hypothetical protein
VTIDFLIPIFISIYLLGYYTKKGHTTNAECPLQ